MRGQSANPNNQKCHCCPLPLVNTSKMQHTFSLAKKGITGISLCEINVHLGVGWVGDVGGVGWVGIKCGWVGGRMIIPANKRSEIKFYSDVQAKQ